MLVLSVCSVLWQGGDNFYFKTNRFYLEMCYGDLKNQINSLLFIILSLLLTRLKEMLSPEIWMFACDHDSGSASQARNVVLVCLNGILLWLPDGLQSRRMGNGQGETSTSWCGCAVAADPGVLLKAPVGPTGFWTAQNAVLVVSLNAIQGDTIGFLFIYWPQGETKEEVVMRGGEETGGIEEGRK